MGPLPRGWTRRHPAQAAIRARPLPRPGLLRERQDDGAGWTWRPCSSRCASLPPSFPPLLPSSLPFCPPQWSAIPAHTHTHTEAHTGRCSSVRGGRDPRGSAWLGALTSPRHAAVPPRAVTSPPPPWGHRAAQPRGGRPGSPHPRSRTPALRGEPGRRRFGSARPCGPPQKLIPAAWPPGGPRWIGQPSADPREGAGRVCVRFPPASIPSQDR